MPLHPVWATYDSTNGDVYVTNFGDGTVTVLNGTTQAATIFVDAGPDSAAFDTATGFLFVTDSTAGNVSVLDGRSPVVDTTVVENITVGTDPKYAAYDASNGYVYVANNASDSVSILGNAGVAVFPVNFTESGLPAGTEWSVTLNGTLLTSSTAWIVADEPNGTYSFAVGSQAGYTRAPSSGSILVSGAGQSQAIVFTATPATFAVSFVESGLPAGTTWSVTFNGSLMSSGTDTITFSGLPNGTFSFTIGALAGYNASPQGGSVQVAGQAVSRTISFTPIASTYAVSFVESGLPAGTTWSVVFNGTTKSSGTNTIAFSGFPNGTFPYTVTAVSGYNATPSQGSLVVAGHIISQSIKFTLAPGSTSPATSGLSPTEWYGIVGGVIAALLVVLLLFALFGRRKRYSASFTESGPPFRCQLDSCSRRDLP